MNASAGNLTRRSFLLGATALGATLALAGCGEPNAKNASTKADAETPSARSADVVVVGGGLSGLSCARAAAEGGASVILVDKAPFVGSTFQTSMGNVSILQTAENKQWWQFEDGTVDTVEDFLARYRKATETGKVNAPYPDYDRVEALMLESCETISWVEELGVDFQKSFTKETVATDTVKPDPSNLGDTLPGAFVIGKLEQAIDQLGVATMLSTAVTGLVVEDGAVVGVRTDDPGNPEIRGGSVVLAMGGFGGSAEFLDKLVPAVNKIGFQYQGNAMNTGDAMVVAADAGAALYEDCWVIPNVIVPAKALTDADERFQLLCDQSIHGKALEGGHTSSKLIVNAAGERFMNESMPPIGLATTMADRDEAPYYALFDSSDAEVTDVLEKGVGTAGLFKADTVDALADAAGLPGLAAAFEAYQAAAQAGADEAFGKAPENLVPYGSGPFYLVSYVPSFVATMGGVKTNEDCQAVTAEGAPIEGLYAIGETAHRFMYNRSFVRHCSNSVALTMGRLVGGRLAG